MSKIVVSMTRDEAQNLLRVVAAFISIQRTIESYRTVGLSQGTVTMLQELNAKVRSVVESPVETQMVPTLAEEGEYDNHGFRI